jgi:hypothetical protein
MANRTQDAARSKKLGRALPAPRKATSEARPSGAVEIGAGVRMRCQELSADLAFIRFDCAAPAPPSAAAPAGAKRGWRPTDAG